MNEDFNGNDLRAWRKARGLRREDIASACHVSPVAVHNWENGRNNPHAALIPILNGMMAGEIAIFPLTGVEEYYLDECVKRGEFTNREDFLTSALLKVVAGALKPFRGITSESDETGSSESPNPVYPPLAKVAEPETDYLPKKGNGG